MAESEENPVVVCLPDTLGEENQKNIEDLIATVVENAVEAVLGSDPAIEVATQDRSPKLGFVRLNAERWCGGVVDATLKALAKLAATSSIPSAKYLASCTLSERVGAGMCTALASHWDPEKNKTWVVNTGFKNVHCTVIVAAASCS